MKAKFFELPAYQIVMLVLSFYALASLAAQVLGGLNPEIRNVLDYADYAVCSLFFLDFVGSVWAVPRRWHYFVSWGWLDLLSSIPTLDAARWGRIARVVRIFRVLRGVRATKLLTSVVLKHRAENTFLAASLLALLLIVFCSIAVLHFEDVPDSNIKTAEDAIWWAFATITTVGYGDRFPTTTEGRFVAAILMCAGVGLFGTFSGFLAAWFLAPEQEAQSEIAALRQEVSSLRLMLEAERRPQPPESHSAIAGSDRS
jgi:voltage-gated potassium channel